MKENIKVLKCHYSYFLTIPNRSREQIEKKREVKTGKERRNFPKTVLLQTHHFLISKPLPIYATLFLFLVTSFSIHIFRLS